MTGGGGRAAEIGLALLGLAAALALAWIALDMLADGALTRWAGGVGSGTDRPGTTRATSFPAGPHRVVPEPRESDDDAADAG